MSKKTNKWIEHIRNYAKTHNLSYSCALSNPDCKKSYRTPNTTMDENQLKKSKIKDLENLYYDETFTLGNKLPASKLKSSQAINKQYEALTGKKLPSFSELQKNSKKQLKQMKKDDDKHYNSEEYKKSQMDVTPFLIPIKKKQKSGLMF